MADVQPQSRRRQPAPAAAAVHNAPLGSVTITAREIYDAVMSLTARVDNALDRSEQTAKNVQDHEIRLRELESRKDSTEDVDKLETRVTSLEAARWPVTGVNALLALAGVVVALIALFHH